ncbi:MAG: putative FMN-dependent luciferase-like monooxygenase, partial [Paracoccaceae bacterium]
VLPGDTLDDLIRTMDTYVGTPDEVAGSLARDRLLDHAAEIAVQVHSVDPLHAFILRSNELFATHVAPQLGWIDPPYPARLRASAV